MSTISAGTTSTTTLIHSGDTTGSLVLKTNDTGSGGTTAVTIDTSQNVGIGTTSPAVKLEVKASSGAGEIRVDSSAGDVLQLQSSATESRIGSISAVPLTFRTSNVEAMRIDSSGNVGIGTSSPSSPLNVVSASSSLAIAINGRSSDNLGSLYFYANNASTQHATITASATEFRLSSVPAAAVQTFYTNGSERMRIDSSGNLLVGTTAQPATGVGIQVISFNNAYYGLRLSTSNSGGASCIQFLNSAGTQQGLISHNGTGTTTYGTSSDYRLKDNPQPMQNALETVAKLNPVTYTWKIDGSIGQGFIAHELQEIFPDAVQGEKDDVNEDGSIKPQGIDTSFLVATLTAAIQEQQALIQQLQADVAALKGTS